MTVMTGGGWKVEGGRWRVNGGRWKGNNGGEIRELQ